MPVVLCLTCNKNIYYTNMPRHKKTRLHKLNENLLVLKDLNKEKEKKKEEKENKNI